MRALSVVVVVCWLSAPVAAESAPHREARERELPLPVQDHAQAPELYVAGGRATVLEFGLPVPPEAVRLLGAAERLPPPQVAGNRLVLFPQDDIGAEEQAMLAVDFPDGVPARFALRTRPDLLDIHVKVSRPSPTPPATASHMQELGQALEQRRDDQRMAGITAMVQTVLEEERTRRKPRWKVRKTWIAAVNKSEEVQVGKRVRVYTAGEVSYVAVTLASTTTPWVLARGAVSSAELGGLETLSARSASVQIESKVMKAVNVVAIRGLPSDKEGPHIVELVARDGRSVRLEAVVIGEEEVP